MNLEQQPQVSELDILNTFNVDEYRLAEIATCSDSEREDIMHIL